VFNFLMNLIMSVFVEHPGSILIYLTLINLKEETMHWQKIMNFANSTLPRYVCSVQCNSIIKTQI